MGQTGPIMPDGMMVVVVDVSVAGVIASKIVAGAIVADVAVIAQEACLEKKTSERWQVY